MGSERCGHQPLAGSIVARGFDTKRILRNERAEIYRHGLVRRGKAKTKKGGVLAALRRSPLVGADLNFARSHEAGRKVDT